MTEEEIIEQFKKSKFTLDYTKRRGFVVNIAFPDGKTKVAPLGTKSPSELFDTWNTFKIGKVPFDFQVFTDESAPTINVYTVRNDSIDECVHYAVMKCFLKGEPVPEHGEKIVAYYHDNCPPVAYLWNMIQEDSWTSGNSVFLHTKETRKDREPFTGKNIPDADRCTVMATAHAQFGRNTFSPDDLVVSDLARYLKLVKSARVIPGLKYNLYPDDKSDVLDVFPVVMEITGDAGHLTKKTPLYIATNAKVLKKLKQMSIKSIC